MIEAGAVPSDELKATARQVLDGTLAYSRSQFPEAALRRAARALLETTPAAGN